MDTLTIIGIMLGIAAIAGGQILEGGALSSIMQFTAAVIVFGGTVGAVLVNYPMSTVVLAMKLVKAAVLSNKNHSREIMEQVIRFGWLSRREGLLALEKKIEDIKDPFFRKGVHLVVDGRMPNEIREILDIDMVQDEERKTLAAKVFESAGGYAPTIGILGAVLGLIHVMENLAEPSKLGEGIAVAFVATVYGVGSANLLWLPIAGKLKVRVREENLNKELIKEGLASLAGGENPVIIRERLEGFLDEKDRKTVRSKQ